jgi:hypothetical protein
MIHDTQGTPIPAVLPQRLLRGNAQKKKVGRAKGKKNMLITSASLQHVAQKK